MRKVIVSEFLTLDGVMEASETWQPHYESQDVAAEISAEIRRSEALLLGRVTDEIFAAYWPLQTNHEFGPADKRNSEQKFVVSSTPEKAEWNNSTLIKRNVIEEIRRLKQQPGGEIRMIGSATLVRSLMPTDLIDEYWLLVHPIVKRKGRCLFKDGLEALKLKLVEMKAFRSGVVLLRYEPDRDAR